MSSRRAGAQSALEDLFGEEAGRPRGPDGVEAWDIVVRWHHSPGGEPEGVHGATGGAGARAVASPDWLTACPQVARVCCWPGVSGRRVQAGARQLPHGSPGGRGAPHRFVGLVLRHPFTAVRGAAFRPHARSPWAAGRIAPRASSHRPLRCHGRASSSPGIPPAARGARRGSRRGRPRAGQGGAAPAAPGGRRRPRPRCRAAG